MEGTVVATRYNPETPWAWTDCSVRQKVKFWHSSKAEPVVPQIVKYSGETEASAEKNTSVWHTINADVVYGVGGWIIAISVQCGFFICWSFSGVQGERVVIGAGLMDKKSSSLYHKYDFMNIWFIILKMKVKCPLQIQIHPPSIGRSTSPKRAWGGDFSLIKCSPMWPKFIS